MEETPARTRQVYELRARYGAAQRNMYLATTVLIVMAFAIWYILPLDDGDATMLLLAMFAGISLVHGHEKKTNVSPALEALLDNDVPVPTLNEWMSVNLVVGIIAAIAAILAALITGSG